ncbi:ATP-binding protein [Xylanibacillus composti]
MNDNATRYVDADGCMIAMSAVQEGGTVRITVKDNGAGIDPVDLPHIYRGDKSRSSVSGGK